MRPKRRLLAAKHPNAVVPAAAEPVPVPDPAAAVPADVVNVLGVTEMAPVREDERDLAAKSGRDVLLVVEQVLAVVFAQVRVHLHCPLDHGVAAHEILAFPQEGKDLVSAAADHDLGRHYKAVAELLDLSGVGRIDQGTETILAELLGEMGLF